MIEQSTSWGFETDPDFRPVKGKGLWIVRGELVYISKDGRRFLVPSGFITDFASVPRPFWAICSPFDPYHRLPAVLHDLLYNQRGYSPYNLTRAECDAVFLEAMESQGEPAWSRLAIYSAVRVFGGFYSSGPNELGRRWKR